MKRAALAALALCAAPQGAHAAGSSRAPARSGSVAAAPDEVRALVAQGLDMGETIVDGRIAVVVHSVADARALRAAGLRFRPAPTAHAAARPTLPSGRTDYRDLDDYYAGLAQMVTQHGSMARLVTIGRSVQGRPIQGVEIAAHVRRRPDGRPTHVELGLHHAREWSSGEVVMEYGLDLLKGYGKDPRITRLLRRERTFLFPVINPDGFQISRTTVPLQRKNAAGVDLNRNYGAFWGGPGASDSPASDLYRGPAPFSEPESQAVRDWSVAHQVILINSNHNYAGDVLYQPGFARADEPGLPMGSTLPESGAFAHVAQRMAAAAGYVAMPAYGLYDATGATEDFNYFAQGAFGYTTEVGYDDFQPDFQDGVVDQYLGTADGPMDLGRPTSRGLRESFLRAGEAAIAKSSHGTIVGRAPAGARLTISKDVQLSTSYLLTATDTPLQTAGDASPFPVHLTSTLRVPKSGHYTWAVNPSTPPLTALAGGTAAWTLTCGRERRAITVGLGQTVRANLRCGPARRT
ncbi:MAG: carboxypeptidase [Solirubrobacteraceae bacterium]|nr:carboxypeptidase [Solirubrobacteraceae bacterium]